MPSPRRQGRRSLVGGIIIVVLVTSAVAIFFLDRLTMLFHRTYTVVAVFPEAPGLRSGTPVWVAGVQVGSIRDISLLPPGDSLARVALDMELARSVGPQLRRDSHVRLASMRMVGEKVVEVLPGSGASPQLSDGDTLRVGGSLRPEQLMAAAQATRLELDSLMLESRALRAQLAARQPQIRRVLREATLARQELASVQAAFSGGALSRLMGLQQPGGPLDRVQQRAAEIGRLVGETRDRTARFRRELAPRQQSLMAHAHQLQADIAALRALLADSSGTLPRMQRDSAVQRALQGTSAALDSLVVEARQHPWRFFF